MISRRLLCPSAPGEEGAILLGIIEGRGRVAFLKSTFRVTDEFLQIARSGRAPEKRFRFSSPCRKGACQQWTGTNCGLIERLDPLHNQDTGSDLPDCPIRPQCRWYHQRGHAACSVCPWVITDITEARASSQ